MKPLRNLNMTTKSKNIALLFTVVMFSCVPPGLWAAGFRIPDQDAFATARGEAFAATANNPSAIYYNPAGITQLEGHNARAGVYGLWLNTSYESPSGGSSDTEDQLNAVPQLFYVYTPKQFPLSFGFGLYAPYGLSTEWPEDTGFRSVALEGELTYITANPVIAWKVLPTLSIAAGPTFNYSEATLRQGITPFPNNDEFEFEGDAVDYGFNAGILWQPHPKISFGVNYRSQTTMDFDGDTTTRFVIAPPGFPNFLKLDARAELEIPQNAVFGISFRPTPKWNFEFNADWTDWDRLNSLQIRQALPVPATILNWESSFYYEFGATRYLDKGWSISGGYIFNENAMPDEHYLPIVADLDRHFFSVGAGYRANRLGFDVAYQLGYGPTRTVTGSAPSPVGQTADGEYEFISHAVSVSLSWHF